MDRFDSTQYSFTGTHEPTQSIKFSFIWIQHNPTSTQTVHIRLGWSGFLKPSTN